MSKRTILLILIAFCANWASLNAKSRINSNFIDLSNHLNYSSLKSIFSQKKSFASFYAQAIALNVKVIKYTITINTEKNSSLQERQLIEDFSKIKNVVKVKFNSQNNQVIVYATDMVILPQFVDVLRTQNLGITDIKQEDFYVKEINKETLDETK